MKEILLLFFRALSIIRFPEKNIHRLIDKGLYLCNCCLAESIYFFCQGIAVTYIKVPQGCESYILCSLFNVNRANAPPF